MPLKLLKQLRHEHGVFSARDTDRDAVSVFHEPVFFAGFCKRRKELLMEFSANAVFGLFLTFLPVFHFICRCSQPGEISSCQAEAFSAAIGKRFRHRDRTNAPLTVNDQLSAVRQLPGISRRVLHQFRLRNMDCPGDPAIPHIVRTSGIDQKETSFFHALQLGHGNFSHGLTTSFSRYKDPLPLLPQGSVQRPMARRPQNRGYPACRCSDASSRAGRCSGHGS